MKMVNRRSVLYVGLVVVGFLCIGMSINMIVRGQDAATGDGYDWQLPAGFPEPRVPDDNPMSQAKVELGRYLFYDTRLSGNGTQSCSSCHLQALAFSDGRAVSIGSTGETTDRNAMSLTNSAYSAALTWGNPLLTTIEQQVVVPMFGEFPHELGITGHTEEVLKRFQGDAQYQAMFAAAFPSESDPIGFGNIVKALASFVRTLISGNSVYDRYRWQDPSVMSESAQRGMRLFMGEELECHHCHGGFNFSAATVTPNTTFSTKIFFNTGLYNIGGSGTYPAPNTGVYSVSGKKADMGRFRPPSLRNVALTAPYMHDGSIATLEDVIQFYADGGRVIADGPYAGDGRENPYKSALVSGFELTDQERLDMLAFLNSLTDESFITDPRISDPFAGS
jgi:cytochrome c peroxidase